MKKVYVVIVEQTGFPSPEILRTHKDMVKAMGFCDNLVNMLVSNAKAFSDKHALNRKICKASSATMNGWHYLIGEYAEDGTLLKQTHIRIIESSYYEEEV